VDLASRLKVNKEKKISASLEAKEEKEYRSISGYERQGNNSPSVKLSGK
tara:strand:+ start:735 stop:881 length:147 start_codon:yes stop_codon:yes gene_type:complete